MDEGDVVISTQHRPKLRVIGVFRLGIGAQLTTSIRRCLAVGRVGVPPELSGVAKIAGGQVVVQVSYQLTIATLP